MLFTPSSATDRGDVWLTTGFECLPLQDAELFYMPAFYSAAESHFLLQSLLLGTPWQQDTLRFGGKSVLVPRLQAWYGDPGTAYGYSGLQLHPLQWTPLLLSIRQRIEQTLSLSFNSVLLNYYRDGRDSASWHSDDEKELGRDPIIASLSLGIQRTFMLKHRHNKPGRGTYRMQLATGSLLVMGKGLQQYWLHQLPKEPAIAEPRLNLTFRLIHRMA